MIRSKKTMTANDMMLKTRKGNARSYSPNTVDRPSTSPES